MRYYVKTGHVDTFLNAKSHKDAAIKTLETSKENFGICIIVSKKEINPENSSCEVYFLTEHILEECVFMRVVS